MGEITEASGSQMPLSLVPQMNSRTNGPSNHIWHRRLEDCLMCLMYLMTSLSTALLLAFDGRFRELSPVEDAVGSGT